MELALTLKTLWQRRRLVAVGAVVALFVALLSIYRIGLFPPSLEGRTNVFAAASSQILVDTPDSAFADLSYDLESLDTRASVFARFLASPAAVALIAREARLPADAIEAQGPFELNVPEVQRAPTAERRSSQIIGERALYRLRFENNPSLPIVSVFAQAPERREAVRLAAAVPVALRKYIAGIQRQQDTPPERQVEVRPLGATTGGIVNQGANLQIATLVFVVVFTGWCMLLIPARTIARGWRELGEESGGSNGRRNGLRHDGDARRAARERQPAG
ncbi:MAG TPA: hypothetical protein VH703_02485 [Solirubrobacterales bacterium]|jgi:hypothetical protein